MTTGLMALPTELILEIFQYSDKKDLKAARLASKQLSHCAERFLFTTVFISPHESNLTVFQAVTQHPRFRKYVQELKYDAVHFRLGWSLLDYIRALFQDWSCMTPRIGLYDAQIAEFYSMLSKNGYAPCHLTAAQETRCMTFTFIQDGYRHYNASAEVEDQSFPAQEYEDTFRNGIAGLESIETVSVSDSWPSVKDAKHGIGSPLARSWNYSYLCPRELVYRPVHSDIYCEHTLITKCLAETQKHICHFRTDTLIPFRAFAKSYTKPSHDTHNYIKVFSSLETLHLWLIDPNDLYNMHCCGNLEELGDCLQHLTHLKGLSLNLPWLSSLPSSAYTIIFTKTHIWPALTNLDLWRLPLRSEELVQLVMTNTPKLRHLVLHSITLCNGSWDGIFEFLKQANLLRSLKISKTERSSLINCRGRSYPPPHYVEMGLSYESITNFMQLVETYVVSSKQDPALKHPALREHQSKEESLDFLVDLFRICEAEGTTELVNKMKQYTDSSMWNK